MKILYRNSSIGKRLIKRGTSVGIENKKSFSKRLVFQGGITGHGSMIKEHSRVGSFYFYLKSNTVEGLACPMYISIPVHLAKKNPA
jgi:hypothetical protein